MQPATRQKIKSHKSVGLPGVCSARRSLSLVADWELLAEREPDNPTHWCGLGTAYASAGSHALAVSAFVCATSFCADDYDAQYGLACSLMALGDTHEAVTMLQRLINVDPDNTRALFALGTALTEIGELDAAELAFLQLIVRRSDYAEAHCNIGRIHLLRGDSSCGAALTALEAARRLDPRSVPTLVNIGAVQLRLGRLAPAAAALREALALQPDYYPAFSNLLYCLQNDHTITNDDLYQEHRKFGQQFETSYKSTWPRHSNLADPDRRLRVGYVSGDLRDHPVSFFLEPILATHNKADFHIHLYGNSHQVDHVTERLMRYADAWTPCCGMSDDALFQRIVDDQIDILVDLSGHTAGHRLLVFARKPAPVQVTYIGYGGTTGLTAIDYRITDRWLDPVGVTDSFHSEQLIRLPSGGAVFEGIADAPDVAALPALRGNGVVLACLNAPRKISPPVIALWARILTAQPEATLLLGGTSDAAVKQHLHAQFGAAGIEATRIKFQPWVPMHDYLALHNQIDLALDPFPYNGGTTSCHSLWMGVPFVTLAGNRTMSRVGAGILGSLGLDDWVAQSEDEYVGIVDQKLGDLAALDRLRSTLRARISPSASGRRATLTHELECAYRAMWSKWCHAIATPTYPKAQLEKCVVLESAAKKLTSVAELVAR